MGLLLLFITVVLWSFVGILVKTAALMVDSSTITLARFFFAVVFLGIMVLLRDKRITIHWREKWIWYGVLGKSINYICENIGLSIGYAYGNILVLPIQTIFMIFISIFYFKEKLDSKGMIAVVLCVAGALLISWNGLPASVFLKNNLLTTLLFIASAIGVVFHMLSQRVLIKTLDSANMNLSVFLFSSMLTALPLPFTFRYSGTFHPWAFLSLVGLGLITGLSFFLYANALKRVTFLTAVIVGNSSILFVLLWSKLFFNEPVTPYIVTGALIFLVGIVLMNIPTSLTNRLRGFIRERKQNYDI